MKQDFLNSSVMSSVVKRSIWIFRNNRDRYIAKSRVSKNSEISSKLQTQRWFQIDQSVFENMIRQRLRSKCMIKSSLVCVTFVNKSAAHVLENVICLSIMSCHCRRTVNQIDWATMQSQNNASSAVCIRRWSNHFCSFKLHLCE